MFLAFLFLNHLVIFLTIEVLAKPPVLTSKTLHPYARSGRGGRGLSEPQGGFARGSAVSENELTLPGLSLRGQ